MDPTVTTSAEHAPDRQWGRLMAAAQAGDADAYRTLLAALAVWLRQYYATRLPAGVIDDAVQDALCAIHARRHTYSPARSFLRWLEAIARYKSADRLRR